MCNKITTTDTTNSNSNENKIHQDYIDELDINTEMGIARTNMLGTLYSIKEKKSLIRKVFNGVSFVGVCVLCTKVGIGIVRKLFFI